MEFLRKPALLNQTNKPNPIAIGKETIKQTP